MISFANVAVGGGGSVGCARCTLPAAAKFHTSEEILGRIREIADQWDSGPGPNITLVGAEPFAHADLPAIVAGAAKLGVQRIRLRTDGGALSVEGNARGAVHAGVRLIDLMVLGGRAVHDELSATPGLFSAAQQGAHAFAEATREAGVTTVVTGTVPVCRHNLDALPEAVASLAEMGAVAVELDVTDSALQAVGLAKWLSAALETGTVNGVWVFVSNAGEALAPVVGLHAVAPCARWRE